MILFVIGPGAGALQALDTIGDLISSGYRVEVILEQGAERFVGPAAFAGLAPVVERPTEAPEALIFAPATAGTLARLAHGLGAGPAEESYVAGMRPAVIVPELDEATAGHPAVRENIELLRRDGCRMLEEDEEGRGVGAAEVAGAVLNSLGGPLSGMRVLVTAGGTREPVDKVRFVGNRSSGKMGRAIAREAYRRGAEVMVVAANIEVREPGVRWVDIETYAEMEEATARLAAYSDALIMAAAVSDFTPAEVVEGKIRRGSAKELELKLVATGDIIKNVRESNLQLFVVGFAATFGNPVADAREKLETKNVDIVVGNDVSLAGSGFSSEENEVHIVGRTGENFVPRSTKKEVAGAILDAVAMEIDKERQGKHG
ncbi:MAG TPA: bifunctional phosphopantothenoylcysteine decarboxylase/phosphopantothenate--cysteine ligase CoaBC [Rubrobacteraceae bacterium]|nr:bifunctional phosphopantothenoylcysteine decarboxylase/phosphopantothenate--cysteine ligase CoaBC [Rubrobacteraceae bacterium]